MGNSKKSRILVGITRNIILLGLVSLFTDLSSQMVFPLIPLFLTSTLGASATAVGIVYSATLTAISLFFFAFSAFCEGLKMQQLKFLKVQHLNHQKYYF